MRSLSAFVLLGFGHLVLVASVVSEAFASPHIAALAALTIECNSEDDGTVRGTLFPVAYTPAPYFDGIIGVMSGNRFLEIRASGEGFRRAGQEGTKASIALEIRNTDFNVPVATTRASDVLFQRDRNVRIDLFALGQTDPEGLNCSVSYFAGGPR